MKISLKKSKKQALIAFIKPRKKKFYKALWKWYGHRGVLTTINSSNSQGIIRFALGSFPQNYNFVAELNIIWQVFLNDLSANEMPSMGVEELLYIHKKYWDRFHKYYVFPRTKKQMPFPHMKKTEAVKEFLARGFVHVDDSVNWRDRKYIIECTIAPLVWPQGFDQHGEACKKAAELGIPGYTKCPIPSK